MQASIFNRHLQHLDIHGSLRLLIPCCVILPLMVACGESPEWDLDGQGKMETLSSEMLDCYEGFRKFQDIPLVEYVGDYHIYTYCVNKDRRHWVFQDGWADPTNSMEEQGEEDLFLGEASLKVLKDAEKKADEVMAGYCYGSLQEFPMVGDMGEDGSYQKLVWEESCSDDEKDCKDIQYPEYPISYSISRGCYCYGWQQQFRFTAGFPLDSITDSLAGYWLAEELEVS